jgi:periplasmic divalent cation tolerance protein
VNADTAHIVVLVATGSAEQARTIARASVERKLAACAQLFPIQSIYEWQGAIEEDNEHVLLLKTKRDAYDELEACINELHSYDVPEIIALPIVHGLGAYLQWMTDTVAARSAPDET